MCGIAGIINFDGRPVGEGVLLPMVKRLAHRGPDGQGLERRGPVGLGHRRLSIIDLETGRQPMFNEDGQVGVTFNGEIYNFKELRAELEVRGHVFRTQSDTEVIVHGWEQWGEACVERFRGMFAFALADWRRKTVFLARDHFGIKPLYYTINKGRLAFASELQALRLLEDFPRELDLEALDQYLSVGYIPAPRTIYRGVAKLPPAHRLTVGFDGSSLGPREYWSLEFKPRSGLSLDEWAEGLEAAARDSVKAHLVSDVPFGAFLSGGLDSSFVVGLMARELAAPVHTFSIGFEESECDELAYAQEASRRWKTEHHVEVVKPDSLSVLPRLIEHYGEPFADSSAIPTFYVSRLARQFVPMVLSGDGGDEALGGYPSYKSWMRWVYPDKPRRPLWKRLLRPMAEKMLSSVYAPDAEERPATLESWRQRVSCLPAHVRRNLWRPEHRWAAGGPGDAFEAAFERSRGYPPISRARYLDYRTYLPNDILAKVDVASMIHGLEVRTPLIDLRVVEFAAAIPPEFVMTRNADGAWEGKLPLKRALARHFPDSFINRPKQGFTAPVARWFLPGGALRAELEARLAAGRSGIYEYLEPKTVSAVISSHGAPHDLSPMLWALFFLDAWLDSDRKRVP
ncbi:MAG: asparagine synthase (glutamine-hydrolyzing) [Elusimicrobia bacterium]|nr:asparagine synthase (glutamine-hydrolyzing) [Elusimicrobiota bacterium]